MAGMDRRIFGLENEYGVTCTFRGQRRLSPDEVARYLFRRVVSWGRSSNVFLENGARLYLDVGSHPEYATPECDSVTELVTMEDLHISQPGQGWKDVLDGFYDADGKIPCQIDGGLKCFGHPIGASGLRMLYEMYLQFQGRAGARQLKDPRIGMTHNLGGAPRENVSSVAIVGRFE